MHAALAMMAATAYPAVLGTGECNNKEKRTQGRQAGTSLAPDEVGPWRVLKIFLIVDLVRPRISTILVVDYGIPLLHRTNFT